jgi:hypothetical protein
MKYGPHKPPPVPFSTTGSLHRLCIVPLAPTRYIIQARGHHSVALGVVKQHTPAALLEQHPLDFRPDADGVGSFGDSTPCWALVQELMKVLLRARSLRLVAVVLMLPLLCPNHHAAAIGH